MRNIKTLKELKARMNTVARRIELLQLEQAALDVDWNILQAQERLVKTAAAKPTARRRCVKPR